MEDGLGLLMVSFVDCVFVAVAVAVALAVIAVAMLCFV